MVNQWYGGVDKPLATASGSSKSVAQKLPRYHLMGSIAREVFMGNLQGVLDLVCLMHRVGVWESQNKNCQAPKLSAPPGISL